MSAARHHPPAPRAQAPEPQRRRWLRALAALGVCDWGSVMARAAGSGATAEGAYELGSLSLASGTVLPNAKIAYKTHGRLNAAADNAILYPTQIGAQ